jgi:hypothetical protein
MITDTKPVSLPEPQYEDPQRPNGMAAPDAPMPGWLESVFRRINKSILDVVHYEQHEYLEHRKLPHLLKPSEVLVKPHLLDEGSIVAQTVFPLATESCFVVIYTPVFANGHDAMMGDAPDESVDVVDYRLFVYQERGRTAAENVPQTPAPRIVDELKRQARQLKLRNMQFLYFTLLKPKVTEAFDDPHGHLAKLQAKLSTQTARAAQRMAATDGPTPATD